RPARRSVGPRDVLPRSGKGRARTLPGTRGGGGTIGDPSSPSPALDSDVARVVSIRTADSLEKGESLKLSTLADFSAIALRIRAPARIGRHGRKRARRGGFTTPLGGEFGGRPRLRLKAGSFREQCDTQQPGWGYDTGDSRQDGSWPTCYK
ncbi:hypothetical protein THAOC_33739, partial [Thalassiosira oceanica]